MKKILSLLLIFMSSTFIIWCTKTQINKIEYSYNNSYGPFDVIAPKRITINSDGTIILNNDYNSYTKTFNIGKKKYYELAKFIENHMSLFDEKIKEDYDILDGNYYYISIVLNNGTKKTNGWYMIKSFKFNEIKKKIFELVTYEEFNEYIDAIYEQARENLNY